MTTRLTRWERGRFVVDVQLIDIQTINKLAGECLYQIAGTKVSSQEQRNRLVYAERMAITAVDFAIARMMGDYDE